MSYVALGDSITVGRGASTGQGYVEQIAHKLSYTSVKKICRNGMQSYDLFSSIMHNSSLHPTLRQAKLITLYIGGNDLNAAYIQYQLFGNKYALDQAVTRFGQQLRSFLIWLRTHTSAHIYTFTLYNPFPHDPIANHYVPLMNKTIFATCRRLSLPVIDIYPRFLGREAQLVDGYHTGRADNFIPFLQKNPIHPNELGHLVIAQSFWQVINKKTVLPIMKKTALNDTSTPVCKDVPTNLISLNVARS